MAAAAVLDSGVKRHRREQWDTVIAQAEEQVEEGRASQHLPNTYTQIKEGTFRTGDDCDNDLQKSVRIALANTLAGLDVSLKPVPFNMLYARGGPDSIYSYKQQRELTVTWTPKKLVTMELVMAKLALQISRAIPRFRQGEAHDVETAVDLTQMMRDIQRKLGMITTQNPLRLDQPLRAGLPRYLPNVTRLQQRTTRSELDKALLDLVASYENGSAALPHFLARVAREVLTSMEPPEISATTVLVQTFSRLKLFELANAVCDAVEEAHMHHDEASLTATILHYCRAREQTRLDRLRLKIDGYYGGLSLAKHNVPMNHRSGHRVKQWGGKITQGIEKDRALWHALIRANILFGWRADATKTFALMSEAGVRPSLTLLNGLMRNAIYEKDWETGMDYWQLIESQYMPRDEGASIRPYGHRCNAFRQVLHLCRTCAKPDHFHHFYARALRHGLSMMALHKSSLILEIPVSNNVRRLQRRVERLERKTLLQDLAYQRLARKVVGTQMILSGYPREQVRQLFYEVGEPALVNGRTHRFAHDTFKSYWTQVEIANRIRDRTEMVQPRAATDMEHAVSHNTS